jgi:hypothetical protein
MLSELLLAAKSSNYVGCAYARRRIGRETCAARWLAPPTVLKLDPLGRMLGNNPYFRNRFSSAMR